MWIKKFLLTYFLVFALPCLYGNDSAPLERFAVLTVPKSGTHMLGKCIELMTGLKRYGQTVEERRDIYAWVNTLEQQWKRGRCFVQHQNPSEELTDLLIEKNFKVVFLIRDPRDQFISVTNWILEGNWPAAIDPQLHTGEFTYEEKLLELMTGKQFGVSIIDKYYRVNLPWLEEPSSFILVVRYEDLVGERGGGSQNRQLKTILKIADFIGLKLSKPEAIKIAKNLYGNTHTFRQGKIGSWKDLFNEYHKEVFKEQFGQELIELGYEDDYNW